MSLCWGAPKEFDQIKTEECGFGFGAQAPDLPADSLLLLLNRSEP